MWTLNKFIKKAFCGLPIIFLKKVKCLYSFLVVSIFKASEQLSHISLCKVAIISMGTGDNYQDNHI